ncbi:hypothetical protein PVAP13_4NG139800 [Panicum virgatum]|uniref:Mediator complex subunit 15 KIX domain-containing protein n=1 Tax=Panicum virgatum TaxID=38727 RepID=A0A8T0T569_PANVG|nr:hypothetical protein PVAP13_4NG139800 [Panicum virgatum]
MDGASCSSAQATTLPALAARVPPPVMAEASTQIAADPKAAATYGDDWRSQLQRDARSRIISKIMETMGAYSRPLAVPEGLDEILKAAVQLEKRPMPQQERRYVQ